MCRISPTVSGAAAARAARNDVERGQPLVAFRGRPSARGRLCESDEGRAEQMRTRGSGWGCRGVGIDFCGFLGAKHFLISSYEFSSNFCEN